LHIFSFLPLVDLIKRIPLVCGEWRNLAHEALQNRTHLTLLINDSEEKNWNWLNTYHIMPSVEDHFDVYFDIPDETEQQRAETITFYNAALMSRLNLSSCSAESTAALIRLLPRVCSLKLLIGMDSS